MARPKAARNAEPAEAEASASTVSKAEAVRAALAEGRDSLDDLGAFIKAKYGIEISKQMLSSYKAQEKARAAKKVGETPAPKRGPKPAAASSGEGDLLGALETLKPLIATHGADKVHRLIDVLK